MVKEGNNNNHASVKLYWQIAVVLCLITFLEWGIFKTPGLRTSVLFMLPALITLSIAKFVLVCGWYMHLKYDHGWLWKTFAFALVLAGIVFTVLVASLHFR